MKGRTTNKLKGRLLLMLSKHRSFLTTNTAFIRWKVRSDPSMMKVAVDRFALFSKINTHTAFWRLKSVLTKPAEIRRKQRRLEKLSRATIVLKAVIDKHMKQAQSSAFYEIKDYIKLNKIRARCVQALNTSVKRGLALSFERWRQSCIHSIVLELRKVAVRGLLNGGNQRQHAFNRWKEHVFRERVEDERSFGSAAYRK